MFSEISFKTDEEWREFRGKGVGGSDAGACMGVNPWKSPLELWLEKTGRREPADLSGNEKVEWGNRLEPAIAKKFSDAHPEYLVWETNATFVSETRPWAHANIDRELEDIRTGEHGILEIKTAGARSDKDWVYGPPDHYLAQVYHYLSVTGYSFAWVAVLIGGNEYREYEVKADAEDIQAVSDAVDTFWSMVESGTMPRLVGKGDEAKALLEVYPEGNGETIELSDIDHPEIGERVMLAQDKKALESRIEEIDNHIKALIGDADRVETESTSVKWSRFTRESIDSKRLKKEMPDVWAEYATEKQSGRLTFSAAKE